MTISKASGQWSIFEKARIVLEDHKRYATGTLLDIGCGTKLFYQVLQGQIKTYISVDIPSEIERPDLEKRTDQIDV